MRRNLETLLAALWVTLPVAGQDLPVRSVPAALLDQLAVGDATLQTIEVPDPSRGGVFGIVLDGVGRTVEVWPRDLRSRGFQLVEDDGTTRRVLPTPPSVTVRGHLRGIPGSVVVGSVIDGGFHGLIRIGPTDAFHGVQPAGVHGPGLHVVYRTADNLPTPHRCGVEDRRDERRNLAGRLRSASNVVCDIACDADPEFVAQNGGSSVNVHNDITGVLNAVDAIYRTDAQIEYRIGTIVVRTGSGPYTTSDPSGLLQEFAFEWESTQSATPRDVAHLFTGRNLNGSTIGIARLSSICQTSRAYGLSQSRYTSNFSRRVALTAHELGHNWSATHCNGDPDCAIMCSSLGGCNGVSGFGTVPRAQIVNLRSRPCLGDGSLPSLSQAVPAQVFATFEDDVRVLGSGFADTRSVQFGTETFGFGEFDIVTDGEVRFRPAPPTVLGSRTIRVTTEVGTTSTALSLTYVAPTTPELDVPDVFITNFDITWNLLARPADLWFLLVALGDDTTVPFLGVDLLQNRIDLAAGTLDATGRGSHSATVPPILLGFTVHSQLVTLDPAALTITGASTVEATDIIF